MGTNFYSITPPTNKLRARLVALAAGLLLAPAAWAQIDVPAGNPNGGGSRRPLGTWFGFERSAMIYTAADIGASGNITSVGFYLNAVGTPGAAPTKVYLKTTTNATFAAATTVAAEQMGATLVYDATIPAASFTANSWVSVPLTTPFAYNGSSNLEVIVETNAGGTGNEGSTGKVFRYSSTGTGTNRAQFWAADNAAPTITGSLSTLRPNIRLSGLTPLACPPVSNVAVGSITTTGAQITFTPSASSTSYTITYTAQGGTATTVTPAPTASPVTLTGLTPNTTYTYSVVGNCAGGATSPPFTGSFTTLAPVPSNDNCSGATALATAATCTPTTTTNAGATASTGVPAPSSTAGTGCFVANTPVSNDVWYSIVVPASGALTVSTSAVTGSPVVDTGLTLYTGTCGSLTEVGCSDDVSATNFFSSARANNLTPGATIYARVWSFGTTPAGQFGICAVPVPANDAAVQLIYSLAKIPTATAQTVQAIVTNAGASALTNLPVTLNVTGATTFTDVKTVASLAVGASATVTFAPFTANTVGTNTLTVSVPTDGLATNNSRANTQLVNTNTFSYADNSPINPDLSVGFQAANTGAFVVKYNTPTARTLTGITAALADPNTVGRTLYGVVVSSTGAVVARTPDYVVVTADIDQRKNFSLTTPLALPAGDFYVGLVQTAVPAGGARYFPLGTLPEEPTRPNTFFIISPFTPGTGGMLTDAASNNLGIFVIEAVTGTVQGTSEALNRAINMYPNPSAGALTLHIRNAKANGVMQVQVTNMLGQAVHTTTVRDNAINNVDLSGLSNGVYLVRVSSGSEYTIRQLVLTK